MRDANVLEGRARRRRDVSRTRSRRIAATGAGVKAVLRLLRMAAPAPTSQDVVDTLSEIGEPYNHVSTRAKSTFDVPDDDDHKWACHILTSANVCTTQKKRNVPMPTLTLIWDGPRPTSSAGGS